MMSSMSAVDNTKRKIRTAACLIIGDEVLGGKVCNFWSFPFSSQRTTTVGWGAVDELSRFRVCASLDNLRLDSRYEFLFCGQVLLLDGHAAETCGGHP